MLCSVSALSQALLARRTRCQRKAPFIDTKDSERPPKFMQPLLSRDVRSPYDAPVTRQAELNIKTRSGGRVSSETRKFGMTPNFKMAL